MKKYIERSCGILLLALFILDETYLHIDYISNVFLSINIIASLLVLFISVPFGKDEDFKKPNLNDPFRIFQVSLYAVALFALGHFVIGVIYLLKILAIQVRILMIADKEKELRGQDAT